MAGRVEILSSRELAQISVSNVGFNVKTNVLLQLRNNGDTVIDVFNFKT
jgi:hypothetical protein